MHLNTKLFVSTFILIFLAELGDKTQLAAMAKSIEGRMTVFVAASSALVCSTLIAVLFGDALTRLIPARVLEIAAAILFILFGIVMLHNVLRAEPVPETAVREPGRFARFVAQTAIAFEEAAAEDYRRLAASTVRPGLRQLLLALAREEDAHAERLRRVSWADAHETAFARTPENQLPQLEELLHDVADDEAKPLLEHAIEHERATAAFYETLGRTAKLPGLRKTLQTLAAEERNHAQRLQTLKT